MRRIRDKARETQKDDTIYYNHLKWRKRFFIFLTTKWKRLSLVGIAVLGFYFIGNVMGMTFA